MHDHPRGAIELLDLAECRFRAMGTDVHIVAIDVVDDDLHWAAAEVARLESRWSRFRPDSDIGRVNAGAGRWVVVAQETLDLVAAAIDAWERTGGAFDPLLGQSLAALGYDRTFDEVATASAGRASGATRPGRRRSSTDVEIDLDGRAVRVAPNRALDLGGIAKGWAADRLVERLLDRGARGACVNIGGDVAVGGRAPHPSGWAIEIDHDASVAPPRTVIVPAGGAATSTSLRRAWTGPDGDARHHLLDPVSAMPCGGDLVEVTVVALSAAEAEVLTKVAFVAPSRLPDALAAAGATATCTWADGRTSDVSVSGSCRAR